MSWGTNNAFGGIGLSLGGGGMGGGQTDRFLNKPLEADSTQIGKFENLSKDVDQSPTPSALLYACVHRTAAESNLPSTRRALRRTLLLPLPFVTSLPPQTNAGASRRCPSLGRRRESRW